MSDELRKIHRMSAVSIGLAILAAAIILPGKYPTVGIVSARLIVVFALAAGICAGLIAMFCAIRLRRPALPVPGITLAALALGGVSFLGCALLIGYTIVLRMTCYSPPLGC